MLSQIQGTQFLHDLSEQNQQTVAGGGYGCGGCGYRSGYAPYNQGCRHGYDGCNYDHGYRHGGCGNC